jgi:hypothetical protein
MAKQEPIITNVDQQRIDELGNVPPKLPKVVDATPKPSPGPVPPKLPSVPAPPRPPSPPRK